MKIYNVLNSTGEIVLAGVSEAVAYAAAKRNAGWHVVLAS